MNDILDCNGCESNELGVMVPGLQSRVSGLLFADDLVIMAPTRGKLIQMLQQLDDWAECNEMSFGIAKCGVMGVGKPRFQHRLRREPERWRLGGEQIPIVDSYTYLGLVLTSDLDLMAMGADRASKGWKVFHALRPVLESSSIPLAMRVRIVKYILAPTLLFGSELWGMADARCAAAEKVLNAALRALVRMSVRSTLISPVVLGLETDVCPIVARAAASRTRAVFKYPTLRTVVAELMNNPAAGRWMKKSWLHLTRRWLDTHGPVLNFPEPVQEPENAMMQLRRRDTTRAADLVRNHVWHRILRTKGGRSSEQYLDRGFDASRGYIHAAVRFPLHAVGVHWLTRARVGAIWTARAFVRIHWLPDEFQTRCPFCDEGYEGETLAHLLVECPRWHESRQILQPLVDEAYAELGLAADSENVATFLLGGRIGGDQGDGTRCLHWVKLPRDLQLGDAGHGDGDAAEDVRVPGFVLVARFFEAVMPTRFAELGPLLNPPRADAQMGMAALQQQQVVEIPPPDPDDPGDLNL